MTMLIISSFEHFKQTRQIWKLEIKISVVLDGQGAEVSRRMDVRIMHLCLSLVLF